MLTAKSEQILPRPCIYCRKVFKSVNYLKVHEKWHRGELEYPCNVCGRYFRYPSEVKKHSTIHSGELPYKCEMCGKSFGRGQLLNEHTQVEHGVTIDKINRRGLARQPIFKREIVDPKFKSYLDKDLLMNISPNIETSWERDLLRNSSTNIVTSWERNLLRNSSQKNEDSWESDLFRNISPSEITARENLRVNDTSDMDVDNNAVLTNENRQEITNAFSQLTKDYGISISFPDAGKDIKSGSYSEESILGLNEQFIDIKSLGLVSPQGTLEAGESSMDDCKDEDSLPPGWKMNSSGQFLAPTGQMFGSRRAAKEFLVRHKELGMMEGDDEDEEECEDEDEEGCEKCLLIKEYKRKISLHQHEHY